MFFEATFQPSEKMNYTTDAKKLAGKRIAVQYGWIVEEGPFKGEHCYYIPKSTLGWIPQCDLVGLKPISLARWKEIDKSLGLGEAGAEELLKETISAGLKTKVVKATQLKRVNVDTTVQEKEVRFPTDARLYDRARQRLVAAAEERGIALRQNYNRNAKKLILKQSRYAHAKQMRRADRCTAKLKTYLGRVIRDIERKQPIPDEKLATLLNIATRVHQRTKSEKNKIYSVHAPEVECISKGKAHKRYEFGWLILKTHCNLPDRFC